MKRSKLLVGALALVPAAGLLAVTQLADAHYPGIEGTAQCIDTDAKVTVYVESWQTTEAPRRANNNIEVQWDGVPIGNGAFTAQNNYTFTLELRVPADGKTHALKAVAIANFGPNGEYDFAGTSRESSVTLPNTCVPATTAAPATTAKPAPTTTAAPTSTTLKVQTEVLGETVTRPAEVATPVEVLPRFAG